MRAEGLLDQFLKDNQPDTFNRRYAQCFPPGTQSLRLGRSSEKIYNFMDVSALESSVGWSCCGRCRILCLYMRGMKHCVTIATARNASRGHCCSLRRWLNLKLAFLLCEIKGSVVVFLRATCFFTLFTCFKLTMTEINIDQSINTNCPEREICVGLRSPPPRWSE